MAFLVLAFVQPQDASAKVFFSKQGALRAAFPEATRVERVNHVLTRAESVEISRLANTPVKERVFRSYAGYNGDELLGHAFIDTHDVRSMSETLMIVVTPGGMVRNTLVLAFHEPPGYLPTKRWLKQISGNELDQGFQVHQEVDCMTGATMTTYAIVNSVRRILAVHQLVIQPKIRAAASSPSGMAESM